jgi:hypothetical protein
MHYLWDKHATFVIVPSPATREKMIRILKDDRRRITEAKENHEMVYPCQLAVSQTWPGNIEYSLCESQYPEAISYDIILFQPSLFGSFYRTNDDKDGPAYYTIPEQSPNPAKRLESLKKLDGGTQSREFLNIQHVTNRLENQAINPYLMVMNAHAKLQYWKRRLLPAVADPVFNAALDCLEIIDLINALTGASIYMSMGKWSSTAVLRRLTDVLSSP